jgi:hypothetical protein
LILCLGGIFAFSIHTYFLKKGRNEFDKPISKFILAAVLIVSIIQLAVTIYLMTWSSHNQRMNQTGITCGFYRKGRAGLKGCRPTGYPSRYRYLLCICNFNNSLIFTRNYLTWEAFWNSSWESS